MYLSTGSWFHICVMNLLNVTYDDNKILNLISIYSNDNNKTMLAIKEKFTEKLNDEIDEIIETAILPKLKVNAEDIKKKIMSKYSKKEKRDDVIE